MILNSRDGQWIYFYSGRDKGTYQLWKAPFKGGSPVRVTSNGGIYAIESVDGRFLYYSKFGEPGVWKRPLDGGEEFRLTLVVGLDGTLLAPESTS